MHDNISKELQQYLQQIPTISEDVSTLISVESLTIKTDRFYILAPFDKLSSYFSAINEKLFSILHKNKFDQLDSIKKIDKRAKKLINNNEYIEIKDLVVPVATGLSIDLYRALEYIEKEALAIDQHIYKQIRATDSLLDRVLTDYDYLRSFAIDEDTHTETDKQIKRVEKTIHTIIDPKSLVDRVPISRLMGNLNALANITKKAVKIGDYLNPSNINSLNKYIDKIEKKSKLFEEMILDKEIEIHRDKIKHVATTIEDTARYITVMVMLTYTYIKIINTVEHIARILSDKKLRPLGYNR